MTDSDAVKHAEARNSFMFHPGLQHEDMLAIAERVSALGYTLRFREPGYTLEYVQARLCNEGPSAFLNLIHLQEDVSPKAPQPTVEQFIMRRLDKLAPEADLIVTDPYLFTKSRKRDAPDYAQSVGRILTPLLRGGAALTVVVDLAVSDSVVEQAITAELSAAQPGLQIRVVRSDEFHDRFWIADHTRGIIMGTSLNKIGSKLFFIDELREGDVSAVLQELAKYGI